jgi:hypothetical protein
MADGHVTERARCDVAVQRLDAATQPPRRFVYGQQTIEWSWPDGPLAALACGLLCVLDLDLALRLRVLRPPSPQRISLLPRIRR